MRDTVMVAVRRSGRWHVRVRHVGVEDWGLAVAPSFRLAFGHAAAESIRAHAGRIAATPGAHNMDREDGRA